MRNHSAFPAGRDDDYGAGQGQASISTARGHAVGDDGVGHNDQRVPSATAQVNAFATIS